MGRPHGSGPNHPRHAQGGLLSPDGRTFLDVTAGGPPRLLDFRTGQERAVLKGLPDQRLGYAFSPDGQTLAFGTGDIAIRPGEGVGLGDVWLYDVETGRHLKVLRGPPGNILSVAFRPDGWTLAAGSGELTRAGEPVKAGEVRLWDVMTGRQVGVLAVASGPASSLAFSPDGQTLACGTGRLDPQGGPSSGEVILWDTGLGPRRGVLAGHIAPVRAVTFSADGRALASTSLDKTVRLWDALTTQERAVLASPRRDIVSAVFDGRRVFGKDGGQQVKAWDAATGDEVKADNPPPFPPPRSAAHSPNGSKG